MARKKPAVQNKNINNDVTVHTFDPIDDVDILTNHRFSVVNRVINIMDEINGDTCHEFFVAYQTLITIDPSSPITVVINSQGGNTEHMAAIIGKIRSSKVDVYTVVYGQASSAALLILAAGHYRKASKYATLMNHCAVYGIQIDRHAQVKHTIAHYEKQEKRYAAWLAEFTGQPLDFWYKNGYDKDFYFTPEEALRYGIVDEIF